MKPVIFDVQLTQTDYLKFNYWLSSVRQKRLAFSIAAGLLLLAIIGVGIWIYTFTSSIWVLIAVVLVPLLLVVQFVSGWRRVKRSFAQSREVQLPIRYTFTKGSVAVAGAAGENEYTADMIQRTFITKNYLFIRLHSKRFLIIPRRHIPAGMEATALAYIR